MEVPPTTSKESGNIPKMISLRSDGVLQPMRALLKPALRHSYITRACAQSLGLHIGDPREFTGVVDDGLPSCVGVAILPFRSNQSTHETWYGKVLVVEKLENSPHGILLGNNECRLYNLRRKKGCFLVLQQPLGSGKDKQEKARAQAQQKADIKAERTSSQNMAELVQADEEDFREAQLAWAQSQAKPGSKPASK